MRQCMSPIKQACLRSLILKTFKLEGYLQQQGYGTENISFLLDTLIQPLVKPAVYHIYFKLNFYNATRQVNVAGAIDSLRIDADFQVSNFFPG